MSTMGVSPAPEAVAIDERLPCRTSDPDLWFADTPADLRLAQLLCGRCPIRRACLDGALRRREPWGVWGGEIFERGTVVARKRRRGRPSNADRARDRARETSSPPTTRTRGSARRDGIAAADSGRTADEQPPHPRCDA